MNITSMKYNIIYYSVSILIQYQSSSLIYLTSINQLIIIRKKNINNEMTGIIIPIRFIINSSLFVCLFFFCSNFCNVCKNRRGRAGERAGGGAAVRRRGSAGLIRPFDRTNREEFETNPLINSPAHIETWQIHINIYFLN